eukprot:189666-Lingulodinium_polyedra.AAC.1
MPQQALDGRRAPQERGVRVVERDRQLRVQASAKDGARRQEQPVAGFERLEVAVARELREAHGL